MNIILGLVSVFGLIAIPSTAEAKWGCPDPIFAGCKDGFEKYYKTEKFENLECPMPACRPVSADPVGRELKDGAITEEGEGRFSLPTVNK